MCASLHLLLGKSIENIFPAKINTFVIKFPIFFSLPTLVITALHKHQSYKFLSFAGSPCPSTLPPPAYTQIGKLTLINSLLRQFPGPGSIRAFITHQLALRIEYSDLRHFCTVLRRKTTSFVISLLTYLIGWDAELLCNRTHLTFSLFQSEGQFLLSRLPPSAQHFLFPNNLNLFLSRWNVPRLMKTSIIARK